MDVKLVMFKGNGQRKDFPIINPTTVIGRGENCDLRVPLLNVSRRHCELSIGSADVKVKDLASSNGTYVNNSRVNELALSPGDRLAIGPVVFTLQIDGQPEQIKPVVAKGLDDGKPEADLDQVVAQPGASKLSDAPQEEEELDPISALEALASDEEDKD